MLSSRISDVSYKCDSIVQYEDFAAWIYHCSGPIWNRRS